MKTVPFIFLFFFSACSSASKQSFIKEGSWDFGHTRFLFNSDGTSRKIEVASRLDKSRKKGDTFLRYEYYEFDFPVLNHVAQYNFTLAQQSADGCIDEKKPITVYTVVNEKASEALTQEGSTIEIPSGVKSYLKVKMDNFSNCDQIKLKLAVRMLKKN